MPTSSPPVAQGPLVDFQRQAGATLQLRDGWNVAIHYPGEPIPGENALVDLAHWNTWEMSGAETSAALTSLCGADVPLRSICTRGTRHVYRLTPTRAVIFGGDRPAPAAVDVTGGWASLALLGPDRETILNKVTAVDLREVTLGAQRCCQGPIFGVNTLFGRFPNRFELHVCTDSALFFQEVLLDAGLEFNLQPAGWDHYCKVVESSATAADRRTEV